MRFLRQVALWVQHMRGISDARCAQVKRTQASSKAKPFHVEQADGAIQQRKSKSMSTPGQLLRCIFRLISNTHSDPDRTGNPIQFEHLVRRHSSIRIKGNRTGNAAAFGQGNPVWMRARFTQVCPALELCFIPGLLGLFVQKQRVPCTESESPCEPSKTCFACTTGRDTACVPRRAVCVSPSVR